ncbi:MAG: CoA ester lyase [Pseudomonadota bacterium]
MSVFKSLLFVPGARPDRFDKAAAAGADAIIIDLEDAVLPDEKSKARAETLGWLAGRAKGVVAGVRINSPRTADGCGDIAALALSGSSPDFVMVPKADTAEDLEITHEALSGGARMAAVIETARGLENAHAIAAKAPAGLLFGGADFSAELGAELAWGPMAYARARICAAAASAGAPAYDVPYLDVKDEAGLVAETGQSKALGFAGRACIHPAQVKPVNAVFTPTADELKEARAVIRSLKKTKGGAVLHNGKLVDRPVILAAERVIAQAKS